MVESIVEKVASYVYDAVDYGTVHVMAYYANKNDYDLRKVEFYTLNDHEGYDLGIGESYSEMPTWQEGYDFYWLPTVAEASADHPRDFKFIDTN